jgi:hypothetical protein
MPIDPLALIDGPFEPSPVANRLRAGAAVLVSTTSAPDKIARIRTAAAARGTEAQDLGDRIAAATVTLTARLIAKTGIERLIVAVGETSGPVCRELGIRSLEILENYRSRRAAVPVGTNVVGAQIRQFRGFGFLSENARANEC